MTQNRFSLLRLAADDPTSEATGRHEDEEDAPVVAPPADVRYIRIDRQHSEGGNAPSYTYGKNTPAPAYSARAIPNRWTAVSDETASP